MKLAYKAVNKDGKIIQGIMDAKDARDAAAHLRSREFLPIHISPKKDFVLMRLLPFNKFTESDRIFFTRQLSSMLMSGLTLMQAISIIRDQIQNPVVREIVNSIIIDIQEGKSLSLALEKYPKEFDSIYISLIRAGEASGLLDKVLLRLSENLEKKQKLKSTVKSALMYPTIVVIGIVGVMLVMMLFIIPQLSTLYENMNIEMPLPTRIVMGISKFTGTYWPIVFGTLGLSVFLFNRWHKTEVGKLTIDQITLKLPVFGKLFSQTILTEFTRTFGLLVGSGTLVIEALSETSSIAGNLLYQNAIRDVAKKVEKGVPIGTAMAFSPLFPPILIQMVRIGEETGKLDESLQRVSEYFERETEQTVKNLTTLMEPIIMVILGLGVAFMILSVITPIYKLTSSI